MFDIFKKDETDFSNKPVDENKEPEMKNKKDDEVIPSFGNKAYSIQNLNSIGIEVITHHLSKVFDLDKIDIRKEIYIPDSKYSNPEIKFQLKDCDLNNFDFKELFEMKDELQKDTGRKITINIIDKEEIEILILDKVILKIQNGYSTLHIRYIDREEFGVEFSKDAKPLKFSVNLIFKTIGNILNSQKNVIEFKINDNKNLTKEGKAQLFNSIKLEIESSGGKFYEPKELGFKRIIGFEQLKDQLTKEIVTPNKQLDAYKEYMTKMLNGLNGNQLEAFLFHGDPGNGKTNAARALSEELGIPMIYINVENISSMWFGQSEKKLSKVLELSEKLDGRVIVFFDEIDTFASNRENNDHEVTKKMLGIILRYLDGLNEGNDNIFIATTNLKDKLDKAFLSRMKSTIEFKNPTKSDLIQIGNTSIPGLSQENVEYFVEKIFERNENVSIRTFINSAKIFFKNLFENFQLNPEYKISKTDIDEFFK